MRAGADEISFDALTTGSWKEGRQEGRTTTDNLPSDGSIASTTSLSTRHVIDDANVVGNGRGNGRGADKGAGHEATANV